MQSVPTNLITGFLGVGKTTAVIDLLKQKAAGSRWAVLVNEYGEVSIDGALIEGSGPEGVTVQEVAGGCVCCASGCHLCDVRDVRARKAPGVTGVTRFRVVVTAS